MGDVARSGTEIDICEGVFGSNVAVVVWSVGEHCVCGCFAYGAEGVFDSPALRPDQTRVRYQGISAIRYYESQAYP